MKPLLTSTIALLIPSRQRLEGLKRYCASALAMADNPAYVQLRVYVDSNDPQLNDYVAYSVELDGAMTLIVGKPVSMNPGTQSLGAAWNQLARLEEAEIYGMGNDDVEFKSKGWDTELRKAMTIAPDRLGCWWFDDGINGGDHCAFPFVHHNWLTQVGYFSPTLFHFFYHDTWVYQIARMIGKDFYIDHVKATHHHFSKTGTKDATAKRHSHTARLDKVIWGNTAGIREGMAMKIGHDPRKSIHEQVSRATE